MQLVTLKRDNQLSPGMRVGDAFLDIVAAGSVLPELAAMPRSVRSIIAAGDAALNALRGVGERISGDAALRARATEARALLAANKAKLAAPIPDPGQMLFCGANYHDHIREMGGKPPERPMGFLKSRYTVIGPDDAILLPPGNPAMVDWEVEFSAVIGRPCHGVAAADALDYVAGYTLVNDVSARDWVRNMVRPDATPAEAMRASEDNIHGKQFPTFSPMGPCIALKDEIADAANVSIWLKVNGRVMQSANTDDLVFSLPELIAYFSRIYRLMPGDIVTTGTPHGVGMSHKPHVFLKPGDQVEIGAAGIGSMNNPVAAG